MINKLFKLLLCLTLYSNISFAEGLLSASSLMELSNGIANINNALKGGVSAKKEDKKEDKEEDYGLKAAKIMGSTEFEDTSRVERIKEKLGDNSSDEAVKAELIQELMIEGKTDKLMRTETPENKMRIERTKKIVEAQSLEKTLKQTLIEQLTIESRADKIMISKEPEDVQLVEKVSGEIKGDPSPTAIKYALIQELHNLNNNY